MEYGDHRNEIILKQLEDVHAFATALPDILPRPDEVAIPSTCQLAAHDLFADHAQDLGDFLRRMNIHSRGGSFTLALELSEKPGCFHVHVSKQGVRLSAPDTALMWRAIAWAERYMAFRHAAILPNLQKTFSPRFQKRITTSMFAHGLENPGDPTAYSDRYLCSMAHMGYSSLFLYVNLWTMSHSTLVPQLNASEAHVTRQQLRELAQRASRYGLELVLMMAAPRLDADHPAFTSHPSLKGGIVMRPQGHALCTSEPLTIDFYAEQMAGLCKDIPGLGALAFLIGGEGFLHCYTRPVPRTGQVTNCQRCGQRQPSDVLALLLNRITAGVKETSPQTRVIFWPYASFLWTHHGDDDYDWSQDIALIKQLDTRASWLNEIELHQPFEVEGIGQLTVSDYAIHFIGPSRRLKLTEPVLNSRGVELVVKTECNLDASFHSVPYIPVMQRWVDRHRAIAATSAQVTWETWRLNGFWNSPSIEVAFWLDIEPSLSDAAVMHRVAERLYGEDSAQRVIHAWSLFSQAWETVYRNYGTYWWGPLVIGPAHLFDRGEAIFFPWDYGPGFFEVQAGLRETEKPDVLADPRRRTPRFATSAMAYVPERLRDLGQAARLTSQAVQLLESLLPEVPQQLMPVARADVDNAAMCWIILEADVAFHRFTKLRDESKQLSLSDPRRKAHALEASEIVNADLIRAEQALAIVQRTPMIGWGFTFGMRFNEAMIREKIHRSRHLYQTLAAGNW